MQDKAPKILVISHTPFAASDSMGSTLASYFGTYNPDKIAQFFIKNKEPDMPVCKNYYRVTDDEILRKLKNPFSKKVGGRIDISKEIKKREKVQEKEIKISKKSRALGLVLRTFLWSTKIWCTKEFKSFVREFSPDIILLQPGDFSYMFKLAVKLSKKLTIPLVIHQSEAYYIKPDVSKNPIYLFYKNRRFITN